MKKKIVTFGEIMLRLSPPNYLRFVQAHSFNALYGGSEANVAIALANFNLKVEFVTRLPKNNIGDACLNYLRQYGVEVEHVIWGGDRLGIYFLEVGAAQRGSKVIYDRGNSSMATIKPGLIDWEKIFIDSCWFHWSGITPAISKGAAKVCLEAVRRAKEMKLTVSCDLNFRGKLWKWGKQASKVMTELVKKTDVVIGNEEDAEIFFNITAPDVNVKKGKVDGEKYLHVGKEMLRKFPNIKILGITLRGSINASRNTWSGVLYDGRHYYKAPTYDITHIVDRVGGGDSFTASIIYGMLIYKGDLEKTLNFAVAASCLKHTIVGDSNLISIDEVKKIMSGITSGRISR